MSLLITLLEWAVGLPPTQAMAEVACYGFGWGVVLILVSLPFILVAAVAIAAVKLYEKWRDE